MDHKSASLEVASGRGFNFEDYVAAEFLLAILVGGHPLGENLGDVSCVRWQTGDLGWRLDDLLVESNFSTGRICTAISCRSGREVTANGFKRDFAEAVWHHWRDPATPTFDRDHDLFCLVAGEVADSTLSTWQDLLRSATSIEPARANRRLKVATRQILNSLRRPTAENGAASSDEELWQVAARVRLLRRDFFIDPSQSVRKVIATARRAVRSGTPEDAKSLWDRLISIAQSERECGGELRRPQLLQLLRNEVDLIGHPNFAADLARLVRRSDELLTDVRSTIGTSGFSISRDALVSEVRQALKEHRVIVIVGESGSGKSALARQMAETLYRPVVWINSESLEHGTLIDFERFVGVQNSLTEILNSSVHPVVVVFDAVERGSGAARPLLRRLVSRLVRECDASQVSIVLTCQDESWTSSASEFLDLTDSGLMPYICQVPLLESEQASRVLEELPHLRHPTVRAALGQLVRNFKLLDWIAVAAAQHGTAGLDGCVGVTPLVDWLWVRWIGSDLGRHARAGLLQRIGRTEALGLLAGATLSSLSSEELSRIDELEASGLLRVRHERVRFAHDLLGDWARLRLLIGDDPTASRAKHEEYAKPQWHRAVRLYGQWLLETHTDGLSRLHDALHRCDTSTVDGTLIRDLLLEAVLLSANGDRLWEQFWPALIANDGEYLRRLLDRAILIATVPNPRVIGVVKDTAMAERLAVRLRWPRWEYWIPMLNVLRRHQTEVVQFASTEASKVCLAWLQVMPWQYDDKTPFPCRREAAESAIAIVRSIQIKLVEERLHWEEDPIEFQALFAAAPDLPDEVAEIALQLAKRREDPPSVIAAAEVTRVRQQEAERKWRHDHPDQEHLFGPSVVDQVYQLGGILNPWPDGPRELICESFQELCLNPNTLLPLLIVRPEAARELLLAVCLKPPKQEDPNGYYDSVSMPDDVEVDEWIRGNPAMYFRGPFLTFLRADADVGRDLIVQLVNFASERYAEREARVRTREASQPHSRRQEDDAESVARFWIDDEERELLGDCQTYNWFRGLSCDSSILASALMALEKWLYDLVDSDPNEANTQIHRILSDLRSVALAAVLIAVGKRHPDLFHDALQPLFSVWQFYGWDRRLVDQGNVWRYGAWALWYRYGEEQFNEAQKWHAMPHRTQHFLEHAQRLFLCHAPTRDFFQRIEVKWRELSSRGEGGESLTYLVERFHIENYCIEAMGENRFEVRHEWPETLRSDSEETLTRIQSSMELMSFPLQCRERLTSNTALTGPQLEAFTRHLRSFESCDEKDSDDSDVRRANAISGGIAVLAILHPEWLESQPELSEWCGKQIQQLLENPPKGREFDVPDWTVFLGELFITELSQSPDSQDCRSLVAESVMAFNFTMTAVTLRRAFLLREQLGDEFQRVLNLVALWGGWLRIRDHMESWRITHTYPSRSYPLLLRAFVEKRIPTTPMNWRDISEYAVTRMNRVHRTKFPDAKSAPRIRRTNDDCCVPLTDPGFDLEYLRHVFEWLPTMETAWSAEDRRQYRRLVGTLVSVSLNMLPALEEDQRVEGTPFPFDRWVFDLAVRTIFHLRGDEAPEQLWQPILELGSQYHYWVDSFLSALMVHGIPAATSPADFVKHWKQMIEFCLSHPRWSNHWRLDELVIELLGLNYGRTMIGENEQFVPLLKDMLPLFERAAEKWFGRVDVAQRFARFLACPSAIHLINPGIQWLWQAVRSFDRHDWRRDRLEDDLMEALRTAWRNHSPSVMRDAALRDAFLGVLNVLASHQNHEALDLRDRVLSATSSDNL